MSINLDEQQKAAAEATGKNILCLAGPGAGKTRTLVERAAWLIEKKHSSPYELVLITFTRKASQEMRERIEARIGAAANHITIGTFHSIALHMLHRFGDLIGLRNANLTVYSEFEEQYLLRECAFDFGLYNGKTWKVPKKHIDATFSKYYDCGVEPTKENPCYSLFHEFLNRCRENSSLTYGGLLVAFHALIPILAQKKYIHWKHIMVDEAHDNSIFQWRLVKDIQAHFDASLFAIADLDQSVYAWRNAYPEYILENEKTFNVYRLQNNYRSDPEIVECASRLIEHNTKRLPLTMKATREDDKDITISILGGADSKYLADTIVSFAKDRKPGDIAVLGRMHFLLDKLSRELDALGVPHEKIGSKTELVNSEAFRRYHALLKLIVNPFDNFSFLIAREILGITREEYNQIRLRAAQESKSHFQAWMGKAEETVWTSIYHYFNSWPTRTDGLPLTLGRVMNEIGVALQDGGHGEYTLESRRFAHKWLEQQPTGDGSISEYLDWLATYDIQDELSAEPSDKVQLLTVHAAKGLEFPMVIIAGCNDGILPSKRAIDAEEIEEERRLMYVAMTRARDRLVLTVRPEEENSPKSRFLDELNQQ